MRNIVSVTLFLLFATTAWAQRPEVLQATDTVALHKMATDQILKSRQNKNKAIEIARKINYPVFYEAPDGSTIQLKQLSKTGRLQYYTTHNDNAAKTVSTNKVWPGGNLGFNLSGGGFTIGEWDAGAVNLQHAEFNGRVVQGDNPSALSSHASHVAGSMVASGINARAKGMAFEAKLKAFDWNNDEAEMAREAAKGLLISNHSYGFITGWNYNSSDKRWEWWGDVKIDSLTDWSFGYYDQQSKDWDNIAFDAPYYLIVKAAGNDRNTMLPTTVSEHYVYNNDSLDWVASTAKRNPDGPYDCLPGAANAKNVVTIGAVYSMTSGYTKPEDVKMSSFSSWGPTDDGRIKPDLVTSGVSIYSTTNGMGTYASSSGTSMASPGAASSLLLLQQQYANHKKGKVMRSATLKALAIHTADEAGAYPGPDYSYGWGLLNTAHAAEVINQDSISAFIKEMSIIQTQTMDITVTADPTKTLSATLCWTDPAGNLIEPALNSRSKMLINDLDLRVIDASSLQQHQPWKLNVEDPTAAATRGDNAIDNVENVQVQNPGSGEYIIRVSHKGVLKDLMQNYSLVITGIKLADSLQTCRDTIIYNASSGSFDDGSGSRNYADNADCFWKIKLPSTGKIALKLDSIDLMSNDLIRIYDGETVDTPLLKLISSSNTSFDSIYSTSNTMLVRFSSDASGNAKGWQAGYKACISPYANFETIKPTTGNEYEFRNHSFNGDTYIWYYGNGDSAVTNVATHKYTYQVSEDYTVKLVAKNSCYTHSVSKELGTNATVVSAPKPSVALTKEIKLYPNPSNGQFTLEFGNLKPQNGALQIYNLQGQVILNEVLQVRSSGYQKPITLQGQAPGLYILRLTLDKEVINKKIIIE
jgi:hypothetical protein